MRLIVFGGLGQLGTDMAVAASARGHHLVRPERSMIDVRDAESTRRGVEAATPDVVVDAAAFHRVAECESDPQSAFAVNALGALHVARAAAGAGARCMFVSSDYVFEGIQPSGYREDDRTGPLNVYGVSKEAGERLVRLAAPEWLVVRGSGMFGHAGSSGKGGNFVESMLENARSGRAVSVVDDIVFSPTCTWDMANRMLDLLEAEAPSGTYHLANAGSCSWYEFAREIFRLSGLHADLTCRPSDPGEVPRPRCSTLLDTKTAGLGLTRNRSWQEALSWYLQQRGAVRKMGFGG